MFIHTTMTTLCTPWPCINIIRNSCDDVVRTEIITIYVLPNLTEVKPLGGKEKKKKKQKMRRRVGKVVL